MAFLIWDIEGEHVKTQLDYDPSIDNPKYLEKNKVFPNHDIDFDNDLLLCYVLNDAGDDVVNPHAGKTKAEMTALMEAAEKIKTATGMKVYKAVEVKTSTALKLEDEYSPSGWRHEKAAETDLLNGNNDAMTKLAQEKKAIRDAGNAHEAVLASLDPTTAAGADAIIAFDASTSGF